MINRTVIKAATATVMRTVLKGKWSSWVWLCFSECKWCRVKVGFFVAAVGGPVGTMVVVVVLTSMGDHRANQG